MKEVTEWNGKPRYMWCWNLTKADKVKAYVVYILSEEEKTKVGSANYPVCSSFGSYMSCAEIEEETTRLTYYELSQLLKCFGVSDTWGCMRSYHNCINPIVEEEYKKLPEDYKIRYKQGEWEEPTRETVWKWWGDELPDSDIARFISFIGWDKE